MPRSYNPLAEFLISLANPRNLIHRLRELQGGTALTILTILTKSFRHAVDSPWL